MAEPGVPAPLPCPGWSFQPAHIPCPLLGTEEAGAPGPPCHVLWLTGCFGSCRWGVGGGTHRPRRPLLPLLRPMGKAAPPWPWCAPPQPLNNIEEGLISALPGGGEQRKQDVNMPSGDRLTWAERPSLTRRFGAKCSQMAGEADLGEGWAHRVGFCPWLLEPGIIWGLCVLPPRPGPPPWAWRPRPDPTGEQPARTEPHTDSRWRSLFFLL